MHLVGHQLRIIVMYEVTIEGHEHNVYKHTNAQYVNQQQFKLHAVHSIFSYLNTSLESSLRAQFQTFGHG